jgi:hypothetical protein
MAARRDTVFQEEVSGTELTNSPRGRSYFVNLLIAVCREHVVSQRSSLHVLFSSNRAMRTLEAANCRFYCCTNRTQFKANTSAVEVRDSAEDMTEETGPCYTE